MRNLMLRFAVCLVLVMFACVSCELTNQGKYRIDPNRSAQFEEAGKAGIDILKALTVFVPGLIPVATTAAGVYATWKKMKPKLTEAQTKENMAFNAGQVLAELIEEVKQKYPDTWAACKDDFKKAIGVGTVVEQTIRGFRGLNPNDSG